MTVNERQCSLVVQSELNAVQRNNVGYSLQLHKPNKAIVGSILRPITSRADWCCYLANSTEHITQGTDCSCLADSDFYRPTTGRDVHT